MPTLRGSGGAGSGSAASVPKRPYGSTGVELSIVGFGGIVVMGAEQAHANRVVAEAVERGVNYFDVAPTYGDAQDRLGPALEPYRKDVFLACKSEKRERERVEEEFEASRSALRTEYFDLYQLHALVDVENDVKAVFKKGGVFDMLREKQKAGQIRFLGFSAHTTEAALCALDMYDFDSVLFPFNFATWYKNGFGPRVLERAREKGAARLALKAMARQHWGENAPRRNEHPKAWYEPISDPQHAALALRWTLSLPVTAAIPPGEEALFKLAVETATAFTPVSKEEQAFLADEARALDPIFGAP